MDAGSIGLAKVPPVGIGARALPIADLHDKNLLTRTLDRRQEIGRLKDVPRIEANAEVFESQIAVPV